MDTEESKYVIVVDAGLPIGLIANTAAILGITLGIEKPETVGADVTDANGNSHLGITMFPIPILKSDTEHLNRLRSRLYEPEYSDLTVVDFSDVAQKCNDYGEFTEKIAGVPESELKYLGVAICGSKKLVKNLTGALPLLR